MANSKKKQSKYSKKNKVKSRRNQDVIDNIWGVVLVALAVFMFVAVNFHAAGYIGNVIGDFSRGILGFVALILPFYLLIIGVLLLLNKMMHISEWTILLGFILILMVCLMNSARFITSENISFNFPLFYQKGVTLEGGGLFGMSLGMLLVKYIGKVGLYAVSISVALVSLILMINKPLSSGIDVISEKRADIASKRASRKIEIEQRRAEKEEIAMKEREAKLKLKSLEEERKLKLERIKKKEEFKAVQFEENNRGADAKSISMIDSKIYTNGVTSQSDTDIMEVDLNRDDDSKVTGFGLEEPRKQRDGFGLGYDVEPKDMPIITPSRKEKSSVLTKKAAEQAMLEPQDFNDNAKSYRYKKPPISLLKKSIKTNAQSNSSVKLNARAKILEETLVSFNVGAKVTDVTQGPAVTRYEIQPDPGVRVNRIVNLSSDIALKLRARSLRIEAPIPGKDAVGIEIENDDVTTVVLRELIESTEFKKSKSKISFAVGRDISGKAIMGNLKDMPHLLIAGSTGSGKSVCINSIIMSLMYKADPDEVKLVLIDPKVVELGNYNGIPHLLIPVVTEAGKAAAALNWAVAEMTSRYKKFADANVRNLETYNAQMKRTGNREDIMPQIVIIIDELADLMMAAPKQVEESICRLAQLARAAGMHLIVATQRPSVDIITGVIKANIPSRIAFAVSSQYDSRTILDVGGAENLVGKGDMLFNPIGAGSPTRVQGCFVSDQEVLSVIDFYKQQCEEVEYSDEVISSIESSNNAQAGGENIKANDDDEFMQDAVEFIVSTGHASVSMLQRRFRIGYNRAARMIDEMEKRGIVGPQDGSRPRQVLISNADINTDLPPEQEGELSEG